jgi:hypothetical protein
MKKPNKEVTCHVYLKNSKTKHSEYKHFSSEQKSFKYINIQWKFIIKESNLTEKPQKGYI